MVYFFNTLEIPAKEFYRQVSKKRLTVILQMSEIKVINQFKF